MIDIAINRKDEDGYFPKNAKGFREIMPITGADRIAQKITIALQMWSGEWYLDTTQGVPYLETIFVKATRKSTIEAILRSAVLSVQGVRSITSFSIDVDAKTRVMTVAFGCDTTEGPIKGSALLDQIR